MTKGKTYKELTVSNWDWILQFYDPESYVSPAKLNEQEPSTFINLGDLEDALTKAASGMGVDIRYQATMSLHRGITTGERARHAVTLHDLLSGQFQDLGVPDLIVCASGKNDREIQEELGFVSRKGQILTIDGIGTQATGSHDLDIGDEFLESQLFSVFGIKHKSLEPGVLEHIVRKHKTGEPLVEIQMNHASAAHFILQHPRGGFGGDADQQLESYILEIINRRLGTGYTTVQAMRDDELAVWGDPLCPVVVETSTATRFVFDNVVLVGDCGMSCSPSSGLGADIGMTHDSKAIRILAIGLREAVSEEEKRAALQKFSLQKAEGAVMWSEGSRKFYLTKDEASQFMKP